MRVSWRSSSSRSPRCDPVESEDRDASASLGDLPRVDHVAGELLEIAAPRGRGGLLSDQRLFVEDLEAMIRAHQIAESAEVAWIYAVDEADRERTWRQRLGHLVCTGR